MSDHTETTPWGVDPPLFLGTMMTVARLLVSTNLSRGRGERPDCLGRNFYKCRRVHDWNTAEQFFLAYGGSYYCYILNQIQTESKN